MNIKRYNILLLTFCILCGLLSACIDDKIIKDDETENGRLGEKSYLEFKVNLSSMTRDASSGIVGSSDFEKFEDYIDPNNIRVLFFYAKDGEDNYDTLIKQFKTDNPDDGLSFIPIQNTSDENTKEWYIRIPVADFNSDFASAVRENDFKIAVLANWPEIDEANEFEERDPIKKIHHLSTNDSYFSNENKEKIYSFLKEGYSGMGSYQDWVLNGQSSKDDALVWIRENWIPGEEYSDNGIKYKDLRLLWNFDAAYTNSSSHLSTDSYKDEWVTKNRNELYESGWLKDNNATTHLQDLTPLSSNLTALNFKSDSNNESSDFSHIAKIGDQCGVVLETGEYTVINNENITAKNIFIFRLVGSGRLTIKWGSSNEENASIKIERRNNLTDAASKDAIKTNDDNVTKDRYNPETTKLMEEDHVIDYEIDTEPEYLFIYATKGKPVIYEIEYVQDNYLYSTDRSGKKLGTGADELLIPMYGIQKFNALGGYWQEGTVFGLSNFNNVTPTYDYKLIPMLRSVAKVELRLPRKSQSQSLYHHVFLRCLNRKARSEPMDVSSPTDDIWVDQFSDEEHEGSCEWYKIIAHVQANGVFYNPETSGSDATEYMQKLAWYYGSWSADGSTLGGISMLPQKSDGNDYPHILNPMIDRSDFAQFIYTGSEGMYDRYVIYVPEKFVDDPSNVGPQTRNMSKEKPKVCHIEFRGGNDSYTNLDDDWCYRIYFTKNGFDPEFKPDLSDTSNSSNPTWENTYEQREENLRNHWPIMRNHVYSFTVVDANSRIAVVQLKVLPWKETDDNTYDW